ncbi:MAG: SsrA-binding protein SmpB [Patescibacteria group bacterium]|nr:SsrA-binding protein SmpB [Patescibacteria group bacterium]
MESITNKTIFHDYEILETWTAGIVLSGPEVKSVKQQKLDLKGSYVNLDAKQELWLINCHIAPYPPAIQVQTNYQPTHSRKLLLTKKEIKTLIGKLQIKGLTLIPIKVYNNKGIIKIEIGLGRGLKKHDKREKIKQKETDRRILQATYRRR